MTEGTLSGLMLWSDGKSFFLKNMGQSRPLFVYFRYFLDTISIIQIEKSIDGVLGIRTQEPQDGRRRWNHGAMAAMVKV